MILILPLLLRAMAELPDSAEVRPIPIAETVVDDAGRPLRHAEVWLTRATRVEKDRRSGMNLSRV